MEQIHGVDVSWMTHGSPRGLDSRKIFATSHSDGILHSSDVMGLCACCANDRDTIDKTAKATGWKRAASSQQGRDVPPPSPTASVEPAVNGNGNGATPDTQVSTPANGTSNGAAVPKAIPPSRPGFTRADSGDKKLGPLGQTPNSPRRSSWLSSVASKFSSSNNPPPQTPSNGPLPKVGEPVVPKVTPNKNAVLQHATRHEGDVPYTPAPPKNGQGSLLHVFRRLSYSDKNSAPGPGVRENHGLVERRTLNVDRHRERCKIAELNQAKLRRVAFCVDVEIAPMPKYADPDAAKDRDIGDKTHRRKLSEKGEGEALKNPKAVEEQKETDGAVQATGEARPKEPEQEGGGEAKDEKLQFEETITEVAEDKGTDNKKKEKKKKSEEERRARKEKKRKLAEANGSIPLELHLDSDSSAPGTPPSEPVKVRMEPTVNPVRIYRRCCQLRDTPILKKITEQLLDPANTSPAGVVGRLDLTGYWLQFNDLITLGDFFAVVPIKDVILEGCGLTDEGLRVVLAGLLAAKIGGPSHRRPVDGPDGLVHQGGIVEQLVLKNNKIGPEGWKYLALFIYLCRSLRSLDVSQIPFPQRPSSRQSAEAERTGQKPQHTLCQLLFQAIGDRVAGNTLDMLNFGETGITTEQLGRVVDGAIRCGIRRLGLANNNIDAEGVQHVARYLRSGLCDGLDLGGNDLRDQLPVLADAIQPEHPLYALSIADTNLRASSLCKLFPALVKLTQFKFIDLSHNHELFDTEPNAIGLLRRYLPKLEQLKRIHLSDCALTAEQAISIAEIIPEIPQLAHMVLLDNPELSKFADARTEETREGAVALYASMLAAARVSTTLISLEIDVPTEGAGELVRALAKQIVAYGLRNMERIPAADFGLTAPMTQPTTTTAPTGEHYDPRYPDVLQHLVGHDVMEPDTADDEDNATGPDADEDYIIGGTGIVRALATCLNNRGDESRRQSGEFNREVESGVVVPRSDLPAGKAKDMSKHLLASARKVRQRIQPAIAKLRDTPDGDTSAYYRLQFLERTLNGIIKRFEDEFPETREAGWEPSATSAADPAAGNNPVTGSRRSTEVEAPAELPPELIEDLDDGEDYYGERPRPLSRSNSTASMTLKALSQEEGRALRAGHKFRAGIIRPEHYGLLSGVEDIGAHPEHARVLHELLEELGDPALVAQSRDEGAVKVFKEHKDQVLRLLRETDPEHWKRFTESQEMARANVGLYDGVRRPSTEGTGEDAMAAKAGGDGDVAPDEVAVEDD